jgi:ClpP class serine protease
VITAGKYKGEGSSYEPLTEEARTAIQTRVDEYYGMFVNAVARNRGVSAADVRGGYGEGRVVGAKEAKRLGMVDRIETLDETLARMTRGSRRRGVRAEEDVDYRRRRLRAASR